MEVSKDLTFDTLTSFCLEHSILRATAAEGKEAHVTETSAVKPSTPVTIEVLTAEMTKFKRQFQQDEKGRERGGGASTRGAGGGNSSRHIPHWIVCHTCGKKGHVQRSCPNKDKEKPPATKETHVVETPVAEAVHWAWGADPNVHEY